MGTTLAPTTGRWSRRSPSPATPLILLTAGPAPGEISEPGRPVRVGHPALRGAAQPTGPRRDGDPPRSGPWPSRRTCRRTPDRTTASGRTSVSYTHLRAHETRHDLVCRLLLEKK